MRFGGISVSEKNRIHVGQVAQLPDAKRKVYVQRQVALFAKPKPDLRKNNQALVLAGVSRQKCFEMPAHTRVLVFFLLKKR
jgi:hypothetical protein